MRNVVVIQAAVILMVVGACSPKHGPKDESNGDEWPEMESFHMYMAEAFHPFKDSANLGPAKILADTLAIESAKWAAATLPSGANAEAMKVKLDALNEQCQTLASLVKQKAPDDQIGDALNASHDSFHAVMEAWHHREKH